MSTIAAVSPVRPSVGRSRTPTKGKGESKVTSAVNEAKAPAGMESPKPSEKKKPTTVTPQKNRKKVENNYEEGEGEDEQVDDELTAAAVTPLKFGQRAPTLSVDWKTERVYKIIQKATGALGGNGYNGAIYGELTMRSMQRIINTLIEKFDLNSSSRFIDVGAGLGKPNFHAAQDPGVRLSLGVELEDIRWQLSLVNLAKVLPEVDGIRLEDSENEPATANNSKKLLGGVNFLCSDIDVAHTMDPFTHVYMYDLGFPPELQQSIAEKFNNSVHSECLVSYRPPRRVIEEYGYDVTFVEKFSTLMHGSGEGHTAYFYRRNPVKVVKGKTTTAKEEGIVTPVKSNKKKQTSSSSSTSSVIVSAGGRPQSSKPNQVRVTIPGRPNLLVGDSTDYEKDVDVYCDQAFLSAVQLAVGDVQELSVQTNALMQEHMNASRGKRERKPRVLTSM